MSFPLSCPSFTYFILLTQYEVVGFSTRKAEGDEIIVCFSSGEISAKIIINLAASSSPSKSWEMNIQGRHSVTQ
jgi:hypothetical protein